MGRGDVDGAVEALRAVESWLCPVTDSASQNACILPCACIRVPMDALAEGYTAEGYIMCGAGDRARIWRAHGPRNGPYLLTYLRTYLLNYLGDRARIWRAHGPRNGPRREVRASVTARVRVRVRVKVRLGLGLGLGLRLRLRLRLRIRIRLRLRLGLRLRLMDLAMVLSARCDPPASAI